MAIYLTDAVMKSKVTDKTDVYEFFMNLPNVYDRRHPAIFPDSSADLDLVTFTNVQAFKMVNWMYSRMGEDRDIAVTTVIAYGDSSDESIIDFFSDSAAAVVS